MSLSTTVKNLMLNKVIERIDSGSGPGKLILYSGLVPADINASLHRGVYNMGEFLLTDPCAPSASNSMITFNPITATSSNSDNGGYLHFYRIYNSDDVGILQGTVGGSAANGTYYKELNFVNDVNADPFRVISTYNFAISISRLRGLKIDSLTLSLT